MTPDHLFGLGGKTALVTGGATGVGRMAAEGLMAAGARVMIASRKLEACQGAAEELNALGYSGKAEGFAGDVATEEGVAALVGEIGKRTGSLEILMNNAGTSWGQPLGDFPYHAWERVMRVNVTDQWRDEQTAFLAQQRTAVHGLFNYTFPVGWNIDDEGVALFGHAFERLRDGAAHEIHADCR